MSVVGVDTGGTFSDLLLIGESGELSIHKAPSTPSDFAQGVFDVLDHAGRRQSGGPAQFYSAIESFAVGTTIATNTMVTRSGPKIGLLTTVGHGDVLSMMRVIGRVAGLPVAEVQSYATTQKPPPLVPRRPLRAREAPATARDARVPPRPARC